MPVISINYKDFRELLDIEMSQEELFERMPMIGCDIEDFNGENLDIEFFPNRPDLYSVEGIARAFRAFFGKETGLKGYDLDDAITHMTVDKSVQGVRDFVVACEVSGVELTDDIIQSLMALQEDLHWALGRDRKKVAIGVHDSSKVKGPYRYTTVKPDEIEFVPLDYMVPMTPGEILKEHPKGIGYAHIIDKFDRYPIIFDSKDNVLSLPPIINGELTRVTGDTTQFFVDITGTDEFLINSALNILTTSFAERGFKIRKVKIKYEDREVVTPDYKPMEKEMSISYINKKLGLHLQGNEMAGSLARMGYGVEVNGDVLKIKVPAYRSDILHHMDFVEDVAIGFGYDNFSPELPQVLTTGKKHPLEILGEKVRQIFLGCGITEVMTLMLTNERDAFSKMGLDESDCVKIKNPITEDHTILRNSMLPNLMGVLRINKHRELPHRIFEVGDVLQLDDGSEVGVKKVRKVGAAITHTKANFSEIKTIAIAFLRDMAIDGYKIERLDNPSFIGGRCAGISLGGDVLGFFGELNPETVVNFELEYPVIGFEFDLGKIIEKNI